MKATITNINGTFQIEGLTDTGRTELDGRQIYESKYLYSVGSKFYKTYKAAMASLLKHGFEFISVSDKSIIIPLD